MIDVAIAIAAVVFIAAGGTTTIVAIAAWKHRRREKRFPIVMKCGARMNIAPFGRQREHDQLRALLLLWDDAHLETAPHNLDGLLITWTDDDVLTTEPTYQYPNARVPYGGANEVWQTGLAHEPAHHLLHPKRTHPEYVFSERGGLVRLAREAVGMHKLSGPDA